MFSQASVILLTGGCIPACTWAQIPRADTPTPWAETPPGRPPWADTPRQTPHPRQTPPSPSATAADGTHPTGMHPCYLRFQFMLPRSGYDYLHSLNFFRFALSFTAFGWQRIQTVQNKCILKVPPRFHSLLLRS